MDRNQPLYQIAHPPMQAGVAGGLQGFTPAQLSSFVIQAPPSSYLPAQQHLQAGFGGGVRAQGEEQQQQQQQAGVLPLVLGQVPMTLQPGLHLQPYAPQMQQQAYLPPPGQALFIAGKCFVTYSLVLPRGITILADAPYHVTCSSHR